MGCSVDLAHDLILVFLRDQAVLVRVRKANAWLCEELEVSTGWAVCTSDERLAMAGEATLNNTDLLIPEESHVLFTGDGARTRLTLAHDFGEDVATELAEDVLVEVHE